MNLPGTDGAGRSTRASIQLLRELNTPSLKPWQHLFPASSTATPGRLRATFLGVSTVLLDDGQTAILTDGFFSRPSVLRTFTRPLRPNARRIRSVLDRAGIDRLAAVFVTHSHYDHALDSPQVAALTGAQLLGSSSTAHIAAGYGLPTERMTVVATGEPLSFGRFTLAALPAQHSPGDIAPGCICEPLTIPSTWKQYRTGDCYSLHIHHPDAAVIIHASANYIPDALAGYEADTVFLGIGALGKQSDDFRAQYWEETVVRPQARRVVPVHWDNFSRHLGRPLRPLPTAFDDMPATLHFLEQRARLDDTDLTLLNAFDTLDLSRPDPEQEGRTAPTR